VMAHPIVYGSAGSNHVWSARLALAEKGVTHELVDVHREQPHLSRQPFAKVPGFEHDGLRALRDPGDHALCRRAFPGHATAARRRARMVADAASLHERSGRATPA